MRRAALVGILACMAAGCAGNGVNGVATPLSSIAAVTALDRAHAERGLRVHLQGVAIYYHAFSRTLIISDGERGLFVDAADGTLVPIADVAATVNV